MHPFSRVATVSIVLGACLAVAGARGQGAAPAPPAISGPQEVAVVGVFVDTETQQPLVVLRGKRDQRTVAMMVGPAEATGIAVPLQQVTPPRPLTHDLFLTLFARLNVKLTKVVVTDLRDDTYFATVYLAAGGAPIELDARPSDAIALAIRAGAPVYVEERVFEKASRRPGVPAEPGTSI
jgi:bifunctional DNase/RNase